jgi:hypothetical protein
MRLQIEEHAWNSAPLQFFLQHRNVLSKIAQDDGERTIADIDRDEVL